MDALLPSLLLFLWLKSLLNWTVVVVKREHVVRTFSGYFCFSLTLMESLLSFLLSAVFYLEDFRVSGWHLTRFHVCLLAQITGFIYSVLHWPLVFLTGLDNFWTWPPTPASPSWSRRLTYAVGVCLVWALAACYVFWVPVDVDLRLGNDKDQCRLSSGPQGSQVLSTLLLILGCVLLYSFFPSERQSEPVFLVSTQQTCSVYLRRVTHTFISTWWPFIVLMTILPLLETEMDSLLQMNVTWPCFINSFFFAVNLCRLSCPSSDHQEQSVTDGFCYWQIQYQCHLHCCRTLDYIGCHLQYNAIFRIQRQSVEQKLH